MIFVVLIAACAGTKLAHTRMDETYHGKPVSNILVIAITHKEGNRKPLVDKFVEQIKATEIEVVFSSDVVCCLAYLELKKNIK